MNLQELKETLQKLNPDKKKQFYAAYGGKQSDEKVIRSLVDKPENEARLCQLLKLKTESQKITDATVNSADAAKKSAFSANISMICSIIAVVAAIVAIILKFVS